MIVYWSLFCITMLLAVLLFNKRVSNIIVSEALDDTNDVKLSTPQILLILTPTIIFLGMRSSVGDTVGYYRAFESLEKHFSLTELDQRAYGFSILQRFCKAFLFSSPNAWLTLLVLISVIPFAKTLSSYSTDIRISLFVFFASTEFTFLLNGARQFVAVCFCFFAFRYIVEKKPLLYFLWVGLAISFHLTAIVMVPVYFIVRTKPWSFRMLAVIFLTAFLSMYSESFFKWFNDAILSDSVYSRYGGYFLNSSGVNVLRVLVQCVPAGIAFWKRREIENLNKPMLNYCVNLSVLNAMCFIFASTVGGNLSGRIAEYFTIFNLLLYPVLFRVVLKDRQRSIILAAFFALFLFFFYYQMVIAWHGLEYESIVLGISC